MLLVYLFQMHALTPAAYMPCSKADGAEIRHKCPTSQEAIYVDAIVDVAHDVDPFPSLPDRAEFHLLSANSKMKEVKSIEDLPSAIDEYDAAIAAAPWWPEAYYDRARAEAIYGLYLRAIADYERVLKLRPSPATAADVRERIAQLRQ